MNFLDYVKELPTVSFEGNRATSGAVGNAGSATKGVGIPWNIVAILLAALLVILIAAFIVYNIFLKKPKRAEFAVKKNIQRHYYLELSDVMGGNKYKAVFDDKVLIGRENGDIVINDNKISREHCLIRRKGELMYISDLNSKNGTYYDGSRVFEEMPIISGGYVQIGSVRYRIRLIKPENN